MSDIRRVGRRDGGTVSHCFVSKYDKGRDMKKLLLGVFLVLCWCGNEACAQDVAVKTNLLYWATTTPNLGMEIGLGKQTTLDIVGGYNPWTLDKAENKCK